MLRMEKNITGSYQLGQVQSKDNIQTQKDVLLEMSSHLLLLESSESASENDKTLYQDMPDCAEKIVLILKSYFCQSRLSNKPKVQYVISPEQEIIAVESLQAHLELERLLNSTIKEKISMIKQAISQNVAHSDRQTKSKLIREISREIRPLDVDLLLQLLQGNCEARDEITGQDIVLLLGDSGAGKSLTVHFLAGSEIQRDEQVGLKVVCMSQLLESFKTTHSTHSVTRCIRSISIPFGANETVIVCDTPGFHDTEGAEYDIANGFCIAEAMRRCRSIKPVVLMSQKGMGDRCQGICNMSNLLVKMFSSIEQHAQAFTFVFTKFQKEQVDEIFRTLESVLNDVSESDDNPDEAYVALLTTMVEDADANGVFVLDPVNDTPQHLFDVLKRKRAIFDPQNTVQKFVTEKSMETLSLQLEKDQSRIKSAFERLDVSTLKYKLNHLRKLNEHMPTPKTSQIFQAAIQELVQMLEKNQTQFSSSCRKIANATTTHETDAEALRDHAIALFTLDHIQSACGLNDYVGEWNNLPLMVIMEVKNMCLSLMKKVEQTFNLKMFRHPSALELPMMVIVGASLNNMSSLLSKFSRYEHQSLEYLCTSYALLMSELNSSYQKNGSFLEFVLKSEISEADAFCSKIKKFCINLLDLDLFVVRMNFIEQSTSAFSEHRTIINIDLAQNYLDIKACILTSCKEVVEDAHDLFSAILGSKSYLLLEIDRALFIMEQIFKISNHNFGVHLSSEPVRAFDAELSSAASSLLGSMFQELEVLFQGQQPRQIDFSRVQILFSTVLAFFKRDSLRIAFHESYFNATNLINSSLMSNTEYLIHQLPYRQNLEASTVTKCKVCWENLQSAGQLPEPFLKISSELNARVINKAQSLLSSFEMSALALHTRPSKLQAIVQEMEWINVTCNFLGISSEKVQLTFFERVMQELAMVYERFSSKISLSTEYSHLLDAFVFFECIKNFIVSQTASSLEVVACSSVKLDFPIQLIELIVNAEKACVTLQQEFNNIFTISQEKFQSNSERRMVDCDARELIFSIAKKLETLKQIQQLYSNTEVFPGSDSEVFKFIFYEKPNEIISHWCASNGVLANNLKLLFSSSETISADAMYQLCDYSKLCIDFDHLFHSEPIEHNAGSISNFKGLVQYLNFKLDKYVGGVMSSLKCFVASSNYADFHKVCSGMECSLLDGNIEYSEVLITLQEEIVAQLDKAEKMLTAISLSLRSLNVDSANGIFATMQNLEKADTFVLQYLNQRSRKMMHLNIFNTQVRCKEIMFRYLQIVDDFVEKNKFSGAETMIASCKAVAELGRDVVLPLHDKLESNEKKIVSLRDIMVNSLKEKELALKSKVSAVVDTYRGLPLQKYNSNPPSDIFAEFRHAELIDPHYGYQYKLLSEVICVQITELLQVDSCKQCKRKIPLDEFQRRFLLIDSLNAYLPSDVVATYAHNLTAKKGSLQNIFDRTVLDAKNFRYSGQLQMMIQKHGTFLQDGECALASIFYNDINGHIYENSVLFEVELERGDLAKVLSGPCPSLWGHWQEFSNHAAQNNLGCESCSTNDGDSNIQTSSLMDVDSKKICSRLVHLTADKLSMAVTSLLEISQNQDSLKILCQELPNVLAFVASESQSTLFHCEVSQQVKDCAKQIRSCLEKCAQYLSSLWELFERALQFTNFNLIASILSDAQRLDVLYEAVQMYANTELIQEFPPEFTSAFIEQKSLQYEVIRHTVEKKIQQLFSFATNQFQNDPRALHIDEFQRTKFYKEVSDTFLILVQVSKVPGLVTHLDATIGLVATSAEEKCRKHMSEQLSFIETRLLNQMNNWCNVIGTYTEFNTWLSSLHSMLKTFEDSSVRDEVRLKIENVETCFFAFLNGLEMQTVELINRHAAENKTISSNSPALDALIEQFIVLKDMSIHISFYKRALNNLIDQIMSFVEKKPRSIYLIASFSLRLQNDGRPTAKALLSETKAFAGYALEFRNSKTQNCNIEYVLREIQGTDVCVKKLNELYDTFESEYWNYVDAYLCAQKGKKNTIIAHIRSDARGAVNKLNTKTPSKDPKYVEVCTKLMACLFAHWTLSHFQKLSILPDTENKVKNLLLKPHATQVVAIFRMLGMDRPTQLSGHLVQMLTGEGKSVILGVTAAVLALLGYEVYCACYSDYLSTRDSSAFSSIFEAFHIEALITYGTFTELAINYINRGGEITQIVKAAMTGSCYAGYMKALSSSSRERILLLDEVDVFFSEGFKGRSFRPAFSWRDLTFSSLIRFIWDVRENAEMQSLPAIKKTDLYGACLAKFPVLQDFLDTAIEQMLEDLFFVINGLHSSYEVERDKIGYRHHDGLSFSQSHGYQTMFVYFKEHTEGRISQESLERNIALQITCGMYSYAEIPKEYAYVVGVTGTLETFMAHPAMENIQSSYGISQMTYIPSAFGKNSFNFSACIVCSDDSFHRVLRDEIERSLGPANTYQRAILVFFENSEKLSACLNSEYFQTFKCGEIRTMTEVDSFVTRIGSIEQATLSGNITFLVRAFGRGIDFTCYDDELNKAGGIHVIQTFVSEEKTEEIQIKGRTARQGDKGSFSMILSENECVNKFGLSPEICSSKTSTEDLYNEIDQRRCQLFAEKWTDSVKKAADDAWQQELNIEHEQSMIFVQKLVNDGWADPRFMVNFLKECTFLAYNKRKKALADLMAKGLRKLKSVTY